jgi:Domain of unknown function (DUF397)
MAMERFPDAEWRVSSFSTASGTCLEVASIDEGAIAVRNSNFPEKGAIVFTRAEMSAWIKGVKAGEFDDLE